MSSDVDYCASFLYLLYTFLSLFMKFMKKSYYLVLFSLILCAFFQFQHVSAHELLPEDIVEYVQSRPDLTLEDFDNYADEFHQGEHQVLYSEISVVENIYRFIGLGFVHILEGLDHVFFVLALLLSIHSLTQLLRVITAFTLAHSITLVLAGTGFFSLSSALVEPFIALSIALVALSSFSKLSSSFFNKVKPFFHSFWMVFFFGLFHGLGFAGVLEQVQTEQQFFVSSLIGFNIGIEFGQLLIVLCCVPVLSLIVKKSYFTYVRDVSALLLTAVSLYWFIERVFLV